MIPGVVNQAERRTADGPGPVVELLFDESSFAPAFATGMEIILLVKDSPLGRVAMQLMEGK
jgi:hypothetical protein